ncbi:hypothetical protein C5706_33210, partial [Klebsiella pneumoniae]
MLTARGEEEDRVRGLETGADDSSPSLSLRKTRDIPVVMLTARGEEEDRVRGLETGADDSSPSL